MGSRELELEVLKDLEGIEELEDPSWGWVYSVLEESFNKGYRRIIIEELEELEVMELVEELEEESDFCLLFFLIILIFSWRY